MSLAELLRKEAGHMAANLKRALPRVVEEKIRLEKSPLESWHAERLAFLGKEEHAGVNAPGRFAAYKPEKAEHPDCPYCWMLEGKHMALMPDLASVGTIACPHCGGRYIEWL